MRLHQCYSQVFFALVSANTILAAFAFDLGAEQIYFEYEFKGQKVRHEFVLSTEPAEIPKIPLPRKGDSYLDPVFGCKVTRISDRQIDKYRPKDLTNVYSTVDVENCDGTYLMLGSNMYYLYDALTLKMIKPMGVRPRSGYEWESRWHPTDPSLIYYVWETQLRVRNVTGPSRSISEDKLIHDFKQEFPGAMRIEVGTKGTPSIDGRFWVFGVSIPAVGRSHGIDKAFFYDMKEDKVLGVVDCDRPKWVGTSMSGDYMIIAGTVPGRGRGVWAFKRETLSEIIRLSPVVTHSDLAIDHNGNEVFVYENSQNDYVEMTELVTGKTTKLISFVHNTSWKQLKAAGGAGQHISGNSWNTPGWALISTYGSPPRDPNARSWKSYVHYMLELKENPRIWRVCHNRSVQGGYWAAAFASINANGTRAYWGANWGDPKGRLEVYMVEFPIGWHETLMGKHNSTWLKKKAKETLHLH